MKLRLKQIKYRFQEFKTNAEKILGISLEEFMGTARNGAVSFIGKRFVLHRVGVLWHLSELEGDEDESSKRLSDSYPKEWDEQDEVWTNLFIGQ